MGQHALLVPAPSPRTGAVPMCALCCGAFLTLKTEVLHSEILWTLNTGVSHRVNAHRGVLRAGCWAGQLLGLCPSLMPSGAGQQGQPGPAPRGWAQCDPAWLSVVPVGCGW